MNLDTFLVHRDIGQFRIGPTARIVVFDAVFFAVHGLMRVAAKNTVRAVKTRMQKSTVAYLLGQPQPARIGTIRKSGERLAL